MCLLFLPHLSYSHNEQAKVSDCLHTENPTMSRLRRLFMKMCGRSELPHEPKLRPEYLKNQWWHVINLAMRESASKTDTTAFAREYVRRDHETRIDIASVVNTPKFKQNQPPELDMYAEHDNEKKLKQQSHQVLQLTYKAIFQRLTSYGIVFAVLASWNFMGILQPPGSESFGNDGILRSPILVGCFVFFSTLSFLFTCIGLFGVWVGSICLFRPAFYLKFETTVGSVPEPQDNTKVETRVQTTVQSSSYYSSNPGAASKVSLANNTDPASVGSRVNLSDKRTDGSTVNVSDITDSLSVDSRVNVVFDNTDPLSVGSRVNSDSVSVGSKPGSVLRQMVLAKNSKPEQSRRSETSSTVASDLLWNCEKDHLGALARLLWDNLERVWRLRIYLIVSLVSTVCAFGCGAFATLGVTRHRSLLTGAIVVGVVAFLYEIVKTILGIETYHASEWLHMSKWPTPDFCQGPDHGNESSFASPGVRYKVWMKELTSQNPDPRAFKRERMSHSAPKQ